MSDAPSSMPALEENDESYFVSMTDLMVGMLFVFVIMLMSFVLNLRQAQEASAETVESLSSGRATRGHILEQLQKYLRDRGIAVEIELEHGVLRLPEEILFASGSAEVSVQGAANLAFLAEALTAILPCFATPPNLVPPAGCDSGLGGRLEAILIEGHTDGDPVHGGAWYRSNLGLSAFRSISTYDRLVTAQPKLNEFLNDRGEVLFGVSGYGDQRRRQVVERSDADKRLNRRIDLRFLMAIPRPEALIALEKQAYDRIGRTSARRP